MDFKEVKNSKVMPRSLTEVHKIKRFAITDIKSVIGD